MKFTKTDILNELESAFNNLPGLYYPQGNPNDIRYNFFLDLEHGYCEIASSRIHLYANTTKWAIVFETAGYQTRSDAAEIILTYIGNCIDYPVERTPERDYITNMAEVILIAQEEFGRIENKDGDEMEAFELIAKDTTHIKIRDHMFLFEPDHNKYEQLGIMTRTDDNSGNLIGFGGLIRYLHETNPALISATENDITKYIPPDLPKLISISKFHFSSAYNKNNPPARQELFQLIADVLVTGNPANWKPTQQANNHWTNWESGSL